MNAKRLEIIDTLEAGARVELNGVRASLITIENWNYETSAIGNGTIAIQATNQRDNIQVELPTDITMTITITLNEQAYAFGDNETILIQSTDQTQIGRVTIEGPKGQSNLRQNFSVL